MMILMRDAMEAGMKIGTAMVMEGKENMTIEMMIVVGIPTQVDVMEITIAEMVKNAMEEIVLGMVIIGDGEVLMTTNMVQEGIKIETAMTVLGISRVIELFFHYYVEEPLFFVIRNMDKIPL